MIWLLLGACGGVGNETVAPPGDPTRFDPVAALDSVAAYAGPGARVVSFRAGWVRSDGTIDLTKATGNPVNYVFVREVPAPADAPPVGAGGSVDGKYHVDVTVDVGQPGRWQHVSSSGSEWDYEFRGMERSEGSIQPGGAPAGLGPGPTCALGGLYQQLAGIPAGAVATVDYSGYRYDVSVTGTPVRGAFDARCHPEGDAMAPPTAPPIEPPDDGRREKAKVHRGR